VKFAGGAIVTMLKSETFHEIGKVGEARAKALLTRVKQALTNLAFDPYTQVNDTRVMYHPITLKSKLAKLDPQNYPIRPDYLQVWNVCTLEYDQNQRSAEIYVPGRQMFLGPFMLDYDDVVDLEKVIVHEYLHAALLDATSRLGYQWSHHEINRIISHNLKYPCPPNPAFPSEDADDCDQDP
jgi:hypothetical protein